MWLVYYVTCAQVSLTRRSMFLFLVVPTLKPMIVIIILPTDRTDVILLPIKQKIKFA